MSTRIDSLYELLENRDFLNPETANIFSPFFFFTYDAANEYQVRKEIELLKEKLKRPLAMADTLVINIYELVLEFLKARSVSSMTTFDIMMELDKKDSHAVMLRLERILAGDDFTKYLIDKIQSHISDNTGLKKVYVFIYGIGSIYPYLRANKLVSRIEQYVKDYKVIVFYPGTLANSNFTLFGQLNSKSIYRANHLNTLLP
ncbi:MAG: BREX protein BrxB domain-containing protein [Bacteroidota bacterium]